MSDKQVVSAAELERVAVKSYENHLRAERAEKSLRSAERKLHAVGEGLADSAISAGRIDQSERESWVRSFEADPVAVTKELSSVEQDEAERRDIAAKYGIPEEQVL